MSTEEVITVTDSAAAQARALLARAGLPAGGLRVRVISSGCEGFVADLDLAADASPGEVEMADNGVRLYADIGSMLKLPGATLDYQPTGHGSEFAWSHPGATGKCSAMPDHHHVGDNGGVPQAST